MKGIINTRGQERCVLQHAGVGTCTAENFRVIGEFVGVI